MVVDGQHTIDWRKELEESQLYVAIITESFCDDMMCLEQTLFAKEYQIPTIILWHKGVVIDIPDLLEGMDIRETLYFNEENKHEIKAVMERAIKKINSEQKKKDRKRWKTGGIQKG